MTLGRNTLRRTAVVLPGWHHRATWTMGLLDPALPTVEQDIKLF
jgi:hypothetical protein